MAYSKVTLLDQQAAGTGSPVACDYQFETLQQRRFFVVMNAADRIFIEGSADGVRFIPLRAAITGDATALFAFDGPIAAVRARKVGAAGNALVVGLI